MARTATTIGFSVPPEIKAEFERLAREEGRTKSELFREMVRRYRVQRDLLVLEEMVAYGRARARELGIKSEKDVERLIHEMRGVDEAEET